MYNNIPLNSQVPLNAPPMRYNFQEQQYPMQQNNMSGAQFQPFMGITQQTMQSALPMQQIVNSPIPIVSKLIANDAEGLNAQIPFDNTINVFINLKEGHVIIKRFNYDNGDTIVHIYEKQKDEPEFQSVVENIQQPEYTLKSDFNDLKSNFDTLLEKFEKLQNQQKSIKNTDKKE